MRLVVSIAVGFGFGAVYMVAAKPGGGSIGLPFLMGKSRDVFHYLLDHRLVDPAGYDRMMAARADEALVFVCVSLALALMFWLLLKMASGGGKPRLPEPREMPRQAQVPEGHGGRRIVTDGTGGGRRVQGHTDGMDIRSPGPKGGGITSI